MYPMTPTEQEQINAIIEGSSPKFSQILKELIESHDNSKMVEGVNYYFNQSDIKSRKQYYYVDGVKTEDPTKPNNKIPHGFHKLLVDQKTAYLVGKPITFTSDGNEAEIVTETLTEDFDDVMNELVKNASNKGVEYLHPYIDEEGNFDTVIIPAEQIIPLYNQMDPKKLDGFIRYYPYKVDGKETIKAEVWDKQQVTYYVKVQGEYVLDMDYEEPIQSHFYINDEGYGWGEVPLIEFRNNEEKVSDLTFYKELIDDYDKRRSDVSNNLEEIQALVWVLKGYEGESLSEFMENLRYYKAIKTDSEGGAETKQADLPIAAMDSHLDRSEKNIFMFGQGVDMTTDKFGNSPSGIALKFLFSLLDMKSDVLERKFRKGLEWLVWFISKYSEIIGEGAFDYKKVRYTFNKAMLMNELEQATIAQNSKGVISDETIVANHPWTDDVAAEMKRLEEQRPIDLDNPIDGGDDE